MSLKNVHWIDMPSSTDGRGLLCFAQRGMPLPFDLKRIYYISGVPQDVMRGAHGHKDLQQLILAVSGSFKLTLDDGFERQTFLLDAPSKAIYVPAGMWRELTEFDANTVALVLASEEYNEADYLRNYEDFLTFARKGA